MADITINPRPVNVERAPEKGLNNVILPLQTAKLYLLPSLIAPTNCTSVQKIIGTKHELVLMCGTSSAPLGVARK